MNLSRTKDSVTVSTAMAVIAVVLVSFAQETIQEPVTGSIVPASGETELVK